MDYQPPTYPDLIIFVRHAQSIGNTLSQEERAQLNTGTDAYNLTDLGREQAAITGEWLRKYYPDPDVILRSYYERTRETSDILYPDHPKVDEALLTERDRGAWHVMTHAEMQTMMPWELVRRDRTNPFHFRPVGGESMADMERRVREVRRSLRCNYPGKVVVMVGHAHWLMLLLKLTHRWTIEEMLTRLEAGSWAQNASVLLFRPGPINPANGKQRLLHDPSVDLITPWEGILKAGKALP
jgi:broad specificity phosphatase PhoE